MNDRAEPPGAAARMRRGAVGLALSGVLLGSLVFALAAVSPVIGAARAEAEPGFREVVMHLAFPGIEDGGQLTISLFLIDDGSDLSARIAEGKAAMLARFPGAVELGEVDVQAQFNVSDNVRWPELGVSWSYNPAGASSAMGAAAALAAITAGASGWTNAGGSGWHYTYAGQSDAALGCNGEVGAVPRDSQNIVGWGHIASGFTGFTCWWSGPQRVEGTSFRTLQELDIIFENDPGVPYTPNLLKALALHEFGHGLGLGHTELALCPGHVMCAGAATLQALTADDIDGVVALYGVAPTPVPTSLPKPTATATPPLFSGSPKQRSFVPAVARD